MRIILFSRRESCPAGTIFLQELPETFLVQYSMVFEHSGWWENDKSGFSETKLIFLSGKLEIHKCMLVITLCFQVFMCA